MSWLPSQDPKPGDPLSCDAIEHVIVPRARDLGGFEVRRALPAAQKQMVGPFIFFDQMGPAEFLIGKGIDVRPHPHIGLATVTYLFEGEVHHRDSLGSSLAIRPGEVNLMRAGRGIVHSERETSETNLVTGGHGLAHVKGEAPDAATRRLFGIQAWAALPDRCLPKPCWRQGRCFRSILITTSERSMSPPVKSMSQVAASLRGGC